jgi:Tol biopolymer transport system component
MSRLPRFLAICAACSLVLATQTARVTAACTSGIVTSPLGDFESFDPSTSADGRYTAFWSAATDLVAGDLNSRYDVFVVDRQTCAIDRVSVSSAGTEGNNDSMHPAISADGRYVAFTSSASNLIGALNDTNNAPDVFVRDRQLNTTVRASVSNTGAQGTGTSGSHKPDISADGRFVAFLSFAPNLVVGDSNGTADVFVRDLINNTTGRVSIATGGAQGLNGDSNTDRPSISADGRYVAFASTMTNLVAGDTNTARDIFRHDRQTGTTIRVSVSSAGVETPNMQDSNSPSISADGRYVAFDSFATNLVTDDTDFNYDVFVRDVDTSTTTRVSLINQAGPPEAFAWAQSVAPSISGDGRYVAFTSGAEDLVAGDDNGWLDVFLHDRNTGITRRVSTSFDGIQGDFAASAADISSNGLFVAYQSGASTVIAGDGNFVDDVFIADWRLISAPPNVDLMRNGDFASGMARWTTFALPDMSYIVSQVTAGVFEYYRVAQPPGEAGQAVVFQSTTAQLLPGAPIVATFELGNSSSARKRITVLLHDGDFSDLNVCTLWLPASTPLQSYTMRTHTTEAWSNATISIYAASPNSDGGFLRVDNVTLQYAPAEANDRTDCVDPEAPAPPGGSAGPNLIANGGFDSGMSSWSVFGQITSQISAGGVFEFYRPSGTPAGVVFQPTGQAMASAQIFTVSFDLGNTSPVRKRVTALLHSGDFTDIAACAFWLPPGSPLGTYSMRTYATKAGTNATLSIYPATVGPDQWIQLDNVALQSTPGTAIVGTECLEPGAGSVTPPPSSRPLTGLAGGGSRLRSTPSAAGRGTPGGAAAGPVTPPVLTSGLRLLAPPSETPVEIQVSEDGDVWTTIQVIDPSEHWRVITLDAGEMNGRAIYVRVVVIS